jgi:hypothetical protein
MAKKPPGSIASGLAQQNYQRRKDKTTPNGHHGGNDGVINFCARCAIHARLQAVCHRDDERQGNNDACMERRTRLEISHEGFVLSALGSDQVAAGVDQCFVLGQCNRDRAG